MYLPYWKAPHKVQVPPQSDANISVRLTILIYMPSQENRATDSREACIKYRTETEPSLWALCQACMAS